MFTLHEMSSCCLKNDLFARDTTDFRNQSYCQWTQTLITDEAIQEIVDLSINEDKELNEFYNNQKTHVLFVFHVPEELTSTFLYKLFMRYGALKATVMTHEGTGRSRGFGFVHFASRYQAQIAINAMDGYEIGYKRLRVTFKQKHTNTIKSKSKIKH